MLQVRILARQPILPSEVTSTRAATPCCEAGTMVVTFPLTVAITAAFDHEGWVDADRKDPQMADARLKRYPGFIKPFRVEPGRRVRLPHDFDSAGTREVSVKEAKELLRFGVGTLADLQTRLAAQDTYGVVMVLQAMDAAGKDGTIRHVMSGVNPQGVQVEQLQDPLERGPRPRLSVALPEEAPGSAATSASSTGRTTRRSSSSVSIPRSWPSRSSRRSSRTAASGSGATARSTTGSAISQTRATASSRSSSTSGTRSSDAAS